MPPAVSSGVDRPRKLGSTTRLPGRADCLTAVLAMHLLSVPHLSGIGPVFNGAWDQSELCPAVRPGSDASSGVSHRRAGVSSSR